MTSSPLSTLPIEMQDPALPDLPAASRQVAVPTAVGTAGTPPTVLDPLRFPLSGSRLIEASAGTGKTFTIAALYLRLVLGHDVPSAKQDSLPTRQYTPPEILVVTFTDAATKELRERIRARLAQAAAAFLIDPAHIDPAFEQQPAGVDFLHDLRGEYPESQWPLCARKLQLAAEWMDEAAVSTIHGWCNRMLREHAFDSDSLFTQTLETDQSEMLAEVVRDYWRTFLYPLSLNDVGVVLQWWSTPDALRLQIMRLLEHAALWEATPPPVQAISAARDSAATVLATLKAPWPAWIATLETVFDGAVAKKQVDGRKLQRRHYAGWLAALLEWASNPSQVRPTLSDTAWFRLSPEGLEEVWSKGEPAPDLPAAHALLALRSALDKLPSAREDVLKHATQWVAARFTVEQERHAQMGFNDLLTRLDGALQGPNGARLIELIRRQFPVALIDEFQDTDPIQYRIFDAIYRVADNDSARALILIGDPKQAIYAFRGADIHTYLAARQDTQGRHYTLGTNYRSTQAMVAATNHVFAQAEARSGGQGAFLFRHPTQNILPFFPVQAKGRALKWWVDPSVERAGQACGTALTIWYYDAGTTLGKGHYVQRFAQLTAAEIVRLLQLGQAGRAGFIDAAAIAVTESVTEPPLVKPLTPGDIAVLVNTGREAQAIRRALSSVGVRSVYLSDKESVFQSAGALELQRWLSACAEPDNDRLLRAALATATLGLSWGALDQLNEDEAAWEQRVMQFRAYRQCWQRQGVLPMLRRLLHDFSVPARLLGAAQDRELTDLLHLAELLQQASVVLDGEHALIRYLAEQCENANDESDARKLRLESDADLVKVVTVHKSKGLEYPLVFLPFACGFRTVKAEDLPLKWRDEANRLHIALSANEGAIAQADRERLGEDLRKLYVALTRAQFATWIGVAPLEDLQDSAIGYLLNGGAAIEAGSIEEVLKRFQGECVDIDLCESTAVIDALDSPDTTDTTRRLSATTSVPLAPLLALTLARRRPWWIASYSALQLGARRVDDAAADAQASAGEGGEGPEAVPETMHEDLHEDLHVEAWADDRTANQALVSIPDTAAEDIFAQSDDEASVPPQFLSTLIPPDAPRPTIASAPDAARLHALPRGAEPGSFLHGLLEWAGQYGFARVLDEPGPWRDQVARRCSVRGWEQWIAPLSAWLPALLNTALRLPDGQAVRLGTLQGYRIEMEFWFAIHNVDTRLLDRLVSEQTLGGVSRPRLLPNQLNGMLKGFIDLVFEHEGRYYVADYKSNWLGGEDADYTLPAMQSVVLEKRYDLQYVLYLFALHRLLQSRLPDYDYDRHIGGAVYLFLRGSQSPTQGVFVDRPPAALMQALDRLFASQGAMERVL